MVQMFPAVNRRRGHGRGLWGIAPEKVAEVVMETAAAAVVVVTSVRRKSDSLSMLVPKKCVN